MSHLLTKVVGVMLVSTFVLSPVATYAQGTVYQPRSQSEMIAYLYGMVTQLQLLLQLEQNNSCDCGTVSRGGNDIDVTTSPAKQISDDSAVLVGKIESDITQSVRIWFEYDTSRSLDERSKTTRVSVSARSTKIVESRLYDLDDDRTYYYRLVVEDEDGEVVEGVVRSFTTDEYGSSGDDTEDSSGSAYSLDIDDRNFKTGDQIEVSFELPASAQSSTNWIGLYRTNGADTAYQSWKYVGNTTEGTLSFTVSSPGEYEFRLYLNNGYTRVATSQDFLVD